MSLALAQERQRPLQAWPVERLGTHASVNDHLDQRQVIELGIGDELSLLGFQTHAVVCLLVGAHTDIAHGLGGGASLRGPGHALCSYVVVCVLLKYQYRSSTIVCRD